MHEERSNHYHGVLWPEGLDCYDAQGCLLTLCSQFLYECSFVLLETDEIIAVLMHPL